MFPSNTTIRKKTPKGKHGQAENKVPGPRGLSTMQPPAASNLHANSPNDEILAQASGLHTFQSPLERGASLWQRASKTVFRWDRLGLRLEHALYRLRKPRLPRLHTLLLLLLDPVAIELSPLLRSGKVLSLRQRIARFWVNRFFPRGAFRSGPFPPEIALEISASDEKRLSKLVFVYV